MLLISVDGGTTNTRLVLIRDGTVIAGQRLSLGLRDQLLKEKPSYREMLAIGIGKLLKENQLTEKDVDAVTVSGMICSESGLYEVPHVAVPVNVGSLCDAMRPMCFPEITDIPFYLIPGVKTVTASSELCEMDIMRGEETELCGIMDRMNLCGNFTVVLPGSHCKVIPVEKDGTLKRFSTTISGELIRAVAEHTILRDGIRDVYPKKLNDNNLLEGFDYAREHGLTEALFKVRVLQKFREYSSEELFGVLCGAVFSEDIGVIEKHCIGEVLIDGSDPFRSAFTVLLQKRTSCISRIIPDEIARFAVAYGAERIMKELSLKA